MLILPEPCPNQPRPTFPVGSAARYTYMLVVLYLLCSTSVFTQHFTSTRLPLFVCLRWKRSTLFATHRPWRHSPGNRDRAGAEAGLWLPTGKRANNLPPKSQGRRATPARPPFYVLTCIVMIIGDGIWVSHDNRTGASGFPYEKVRTPQESKAKLFVQQPLGL